jgi:alpha-tubulin suppressor-like RCC1 family protein
VALDGDDDVVWTWGDERYSDCFGRAACGENQAGSAPAVVADLHGLPTGPVVKIAAGGHVAAALTAGRDCYVWGCGAAFLTPLPTPLDLGGRDVLDVAVGEDHMIVVTEGGGVWVVGCNDNGQLGLGDGREWGVRDGEWRGLSLTEWTEVKLEFPPGREVVGVAAGPRVSFLLVSVCNP